MSKTLLHTSTLEKTWENAHPSQTPTICDVCRITFGRKDSLVKHNRIHKEGVQTTTMSTTPVKFNQPPSQAPSYVKPMFPVGPASTAVNGCWNLVSMVIPCEVEVTGFLNLGDVHWSWATGNIGLTLLRGCEDGWLNLKGVVDRVWAASVWVILCLTRLSHRRNVFPQTSQDNWVLDWVCIFSCLVKFGSVEKFFPHVEHVGFSSCDLNIITLTV